MSKKWTWRQAPGSSHSGGAEIIKYAPIWIWERSLEPFILYRSLGRNHELVQEIIQACNNGRTTAAGSKITSKMICQNLTPYREEFPYISNSGTLDLKYYNGHITVQSTTPIYDYGTKEIIFPDCVYGDLYTAGYWWIGDIHDDDPDTDFFYDNLADNLGDKALIGGEMRYIHPYYSFKHMTELNKLSVKMRGSDRNVSYHTEHNLNTYYAMSKRGGGTHISVVGGDGSTNTRQSRLVDGIESVFRPDVRKMEIFELDHAELGYVVSTFGDYIWTPGIGLLYSHAEEELGLYDEFDKYPYVYIIKESGSGLAPVPIFDLGDGKTLNFSGVLVLGGPTHE